MTLDELIAQYKGNAKAMRSSQAHPNLSGIWDNVVGDLERLREPEPECRCIQSMQGCPVHDKRLTSGVDETLDEAIASGKVEFCNECKTPGGHHRLGCKNA